MDKEFDKLVDTFMDDLQNMLTKLGELRKQYDELRQICGMKEGDGLDDWKYRNAYPFNLSIDDYGFSVRTRNCLVTRMNIQTIGDLVAWRKGDLRKCRNLGRKSLQEIEDCLYKLGLTWHMWDNGKNEWGTYDK